MSVRLPALLVFALACCQPCWSTAEDDAPSAAELLSESFDRMFNYPSVRRIELKIVRNGRVAGWRSFDVAYSEIDGLGHTLIRFRQPEYLRGNALLLIESSGTASSAWLYQPDVGKARRVGTYQRGDAFYGSDLTFEDLENRNWNDYDVSYSHSKPTDSTPYVVVTAVPRGYSPYSSLQVSIEPGRTAIARIEFFRGHDDDPIKVLTVDLDAVEEVGDYLLPSTITIERIGRDWATRVRFRRIELVDELDRKVFAATRLQSHRDDLFDLIETPTDRRE